MLIGSFILSYIFFCLVQIISRLFWRSVGQKGFVWIVIEIRLHIFSLFFFSSITALTHSCVTVRSNSYGVLTIFFSVSVEFWTLENVTQIPVCGQMSNKGKICLFWFIWICLLICLHAIASIHIHELLAFLFFTFIYMPNNCYLSTETKRKRNETKTDRGKNECNKRLYTFLHWAHIYRHKISARVNCQMQ